jgi:hypothetical protein
MYMETEQQIFPDQRFPCGRVVISEGALMAAEGSGQPIMGLLRRHLSGDWGDREESGKAANDHALHYGGIIGSEYYLPDGTAVWIVTKADRSNTTVFLPE